MSFKMRRNFLTILSSLPTWSASHHCKFYNSALIFLCLMLIDKDVCVCVCVNHLNVLVIIFVSSSFLRGGGGGGMVISILIEPLWIMTYSIRKYVLLLLWIMTYCIRKYVLGYVWIPLILLKLKNYCWKYCR